jgi:hypothetical protein
VRRGLGGGGRYVVRQSGLYEHIVRDLEDLRRIDEYIAENPELWMEDPRNPERSRRTGGIDAFLNSPDAGDVTLPACCSHGCYTEPDGHCEHGNPSALLALGVM